MSSRMTVVSVVSFAMLVASSVASAQGGGPSPRDGACFYEDTQYRGRYFCVESGDSLDSMPSGANDRVSSIRIFGRADVRVYRDTRFRGESLRVRSNVRDLEDEGFDDTISSIRIEGRSSGGGSNNGRPGSPNPELIVQRAYQDILERDPDPTGMRIYRSHIIDDGWTEQQVREDLRRSPEYRERNTMTRAKAEEIVRQAYVTVLKREPDAGSQGYVDAVFRKKMTREQLEQELRSSPEYRNRNR
jgi:Peptidase inhibitor family I36